MSGLAEDIAKVMSKAVAEIKRLSDDDLKAFLAGEGKLQYVPPGHSVQKPKTPPPPKVVRPLPSAADVRERLRAVGSEADATTYLTELRLSVPQIKDLAAELGVPTSARTGKAVIADIVKVLVTGRLTTEAIRRF